MKNLTAGIDSDGISENHDIETYYHQCSSAMVDEEHEFLELTFENGGIDGITRIGLDELKELGFAQALITPPSDVADVEMQPVLGLHERAVPVSSECPQR